MTEEVKQETSEQQPAAEPKPLNTIERINLLADLANAAQDDEIVKLLKSRKNGERLYDLFVKAVSEEIEGIMNPGQVEAPRILNDAQNIAGQIYQMTQRVGGIIAAIEQGPGLAVLQMLIHRLGGQAPQAVAPPMPVQQYSQQNQPQQSGPSIVDGRSVEQPSGSRGRGGMLGSW